MTPHTEERQAHMSTSTCAGDMPGEQTAAVCYPLPGGTLIGASNGKSLSLYFCFVEQAPRQTITMEWKYSDVNNVRAWLPSLNRYGVSD